MLKDILLNEAKNIEASVALDSIFESVELSPEVKAKFETVFEATVKKHAVDLAESHIANIAEKAEKEVEKNKEEAEDKAEKKLTENASRFFNHIAQEWMNENKLAIDRGIKAELFESIMGGMKELFVEHNVVIPEESVDVVAEMEEELAEANAEIAKLFEGVSTREATINSMLREKAVNESTAGLTDIQKEKVSSLTEGMEYSEQFSSKLGAIVEMVKGSVEKPVVNESINTTDQDAPGLNFITEEYEDNKTVAPKTTSDMDAYIASAARLS